MSDANPQQKVEASAREINAQAASWIERSDREDWDDAGKAALNTWLEESPAHRIAYWRLNGAWGHTDLLGALRPPAREQFAQSGRLSGNFFRMAAALAVIVVLGAGVAFFLSAPEDRVYSTSVGGHESIAFTDGSRIELNTNTRLRARMTTQERVVWLEKGEAYFQVKHDTVHPFIVIAGGHRVTDLGTKFLVRSDSGRLQVAVVQGRVWVDAADKQTPAQSAMLSAGDVATATANTMSVAKGVQRALSNELSWRRGVLIFKHTTLAAAAAEFNRYNQTKLTIADPAAEQLTIDGTFPTGDVHAFTDAVQTVFRLHVQNRGAEILISR
ncbi:MAG TPA: FecR domain-containing protein [Rhizomicrobium sp.]|nr:FecR domain-containing protein [Rhizomicrobium sp.]